MTLKQGKYDVYVANIYALAGAAKIIVTLKILEKEKNTFENASIILNIHYLKGK